MLPILTPVTWKADAIEYIDQRLLPHEFRTVSARDIDDIETAIKTLAVRGAPTIGIFGAYAVALLRNTLPDHAAFASAVQRVRGARPTAVNLVWAVDRVLASDDMLAEARAIHDEQYAIDRAIAENARELFPKAAGVLTHCNTGPLATGGEGTALGAIVAAHRAGVKLRVFVDETRPLMQGSRLTYLELTRAGIDATLLVDSAAAIAMQRKAIDLIIVGADRIARNGDTANKIGTYGLAILAAHHGIPFYVAAPRSTFDFAIATGAEIPIEERDHDEVAGFGSERAAIEGARAYNPAFDVTPGHLVSAFVTEYGILRSPYPETVPDLENRPRYFQMAGAERATTR